MVRVEDRMIQERRGACEAAQEFRRLDRVDTRPKYSKKRLDIRYRCGFIERHADGAVGILADIEAAFGNFAGGFGKELGILARTYPKSIKARTLRIASKWIDDFESSFFQRTCER